MITPKLKDKVLNAIVKDNLSMTYEINYDLDAPSFNTAPAYLKVIIEEFEERAFVRLDSRFSEAVIFIKSKAHDFLNAGGYEGEVKIMELEMQKLKTELKALESQIGKDKFDRLMQSVTLFSSYVLGFLGK